MISYEVHLHPLWKKASVKGAVAAESPMIVADLFEKIRLENRRLRILQLDWMGAYSRSDQRRIDNDDTVRPGDSVLFVPRPGGPLIALPLWFVVTTAVLSAAALGYSIYAYIDMKNQLSSLQQNDPTKEDAAASQAYAFDVKENYQTDSIPIPVLYGKTRLGGVVLNRSIWAPEQSGAEVARVLLGLCEGPVEEIAPLGAESIFLDDVTLSSYNKASYESFLGRAWPMELDVPKGFEELHQQVYPDAEVKDHLVFFLRNSLWDESLVWCSLEEKDNAGYREYASMILENTVHEGRSSVWLRSTDALAYWGPETVNDKLQVHAEPFALQFQLSMSQEQWNGLSQGTEYSILFYGTPGNKSDVCRRRWELTFTRTSTQFYFTFRYHYEDEDAEEDETKKIVSVSRLIPSSELIGRWRHVYFYRDGRKLGWYLDGVTQSFSSGDDIGVNAASLAVRSSTEEGEDGEDEARFGLGRHFLSGSTRRPALTCYLRMFGYHIGKVPWKDTFTPPPSESRLTDVYARETQTKHYYGGKADKMMFSYRFPKGLYDEMDGWHMMLVEVLGHSNASVQLHDEAKLSHGKDFASTDIYGRWSGVYGYTRSVPFDFATSARNEPSYNYLLIGEEVRTSVGNGSAKFVGYGIPPASWPDQHLYLTDIVNPGAFLSGRTLTGQKNGGVVTMTANLVTESVARGITYTARARATSRSGGFEKVNAVNLFSISAVRRIPMVYPRLAKLAVEIEAQDRLARVPTINVIVSRGYIPIRVWTGTAYSVTMANSANPAWAVYDILTDRQYGLGIDPANIDYTAFATWADYCDDTVLDPPDDTPAPRLRCNGVFDQKNMNGYDAIDQIAQIGRARLSLVGSMYTVRINKPDQPGMMISSAVYSEDSMVVEWIEDQGKPDVFIVEFLDEETDFKKNSVEAVCAELATDPTVAYELNVQSVFVPFISSRGQAQREANLRLNTARSIYKRYEWDTDIEGINLEPGDVILLQSESNRLSFGGKLKSVDDVAEEVTLDREIRLDASIYSDSDPRLCVRSNEEDVLLQLTILGPWDTLTDTFLVEGIGLSTGDILGKLRRGDPAAVGRYGHDLEPVRIEEVTIDDDYKMHIVAFNYDESIYDEQEAS